MLTLRFGADSYLNWTGCPPAGSNSQPSSSGWLAAYSDAAVLQCWLKDDDDDCPVPLTSAHSP